MAILSKIFLIAILVFCAQAVQSPRAVHAQEQEPDSDPNPAAADPACHDVGPGPFIQVDDLSEILDRAKINDQDPCALSDPKKTVKNIVVLFEGHDGYTDESGQGFRKFEAMHPKCDGGKVTFSDGHSMDYNRVVGQIHSMVQNGGGSPVALKNYILRGLCHSGAMSFEDTEVFYFPEYADRNVAMKCVSRYVKQPYVINDKGVAIYPTLSVLGYSYGGYAAIHFGQELDAAGYKIDLGMTVDPVPQGAKRVAKHALLTSATREAGAGFNYLFGVDPTRHAGGGAHHIDPTSPRDFTVPTQARWLNFWQETDNRLVTMPLSKVNLGLHGQGVNNADVNRLVVPPLDSAHMNPNGGHWRIFDNELVIGSIADELEKVDAAAGKKTTWHK